MNTGARASLAGWIHRIAGLGLALFVPLHLAVLGSAVRGEPALAQALAIARLPALMWAEWVLYSLFFIHLIFGIRVLLIESDARKSRVRLRLNWIIPGLLSGIALGTIALFVGR